MAAYPFQQLTTEKLKQLSGIIKEFKPNVDTQRLRKEYNLPDRTIVKIFFHLFFFTRLEDFGICKSVGQ